MAATLFLGVPSMTFSLTVKVRYEGTYQPTISEAQVILSERTKGCPFINLTII